MLYLLMGYNNRKLDLDCVNNRYRPSGIRIKKVTVIFLTRASLNARMLGGFKEDGRYVNYSLPTSCLTSHICIQAAATLVDYKTSSGLAKCQQCAICTLHFKLFTYSISSTNRIIFFAFQGISRNLTKPNGKDVFR